MTRRKALDYAAFWAVIVTALGLLYCAVNRLLALAEHYALGGQ